VAQASRLGIYAASFAGGAQASAWEREKYFLEGKPKTQNGIKKPTAT
jgi:GTPase involved in cell partitioning and DNA repair